MGNCSATCLAVGIVSVGLWTSVPPLCYAQQSSASEQMQQIMIFHAKPEMRLEWENLMKEAAAGLKKAGVPWLSVWETAVFGEHQYVAVTPIENFAQYDGPHPLVKGLGEAGAMRIFSAGARYFSQPPRMYALRYHPELSIVGPSNEPPAFAVVTTIHIAHGKDQQFTDFLKSDILPALRKAEVQRYMVYSTVFGGDVNEWTTVTAFRKFADLDAGPPLRRVLGEQGVRNLGAKSSGFVVSMQRAIARYRPELSYPAPSTK